MPVRPVELHRAGVPKLLYFLCPVAILIYLALFLDPRGAMLSLLSDDAFYYCEIARNVVAGRGCTFDGFARTNGFHPLWMGYSILIQAIAGGDLERPVLIIIATNILLCGATLALLYGTVERYIAPSFGVVAAAAALLPNLLTAMLNGLETGLQIFMIVVVVRLCFRYRLLDPGARGRAPFALGLLLGVTTLSRLDAVFLVAAAVVMGFAAAAARHISFATALRRAIALCAGFGVAMLPYFAWNLMSFGHLVPISSAVKSSFPALRRPLVLMSDMRIGAAMIGALLALVAFIAAAGGYRANRWARAYSSPLGMLALASIAHFANAYFFMSWGVYWWHFTIYGIAIALALVEAVSILTKGHGRFRAVSRIGLVAVLIAAAAVAKAHELSVKGEQHGGWLRAAEWVRENTPAHARFALLDAGLFGYFSERSVMSLDGKANGYEYLECLERGEVESYLERHGIEYIGNIRVDYVSDVYRIRIRRPNAPAVILSCRRDWEVYRSEAIPSAAPRFGAVPRSHFVLWRRPLLREGGAADAP